MGGRRPTPTSMAENTCFARSEEHTSELQSRSDLVCRLLLEKKKKKALQNINGMKNRQKQPPLATTTDNTVSKESVPLMAGEQDSKRDAMCTKIDSSAP